jgi:SAM-dependent methyltransferase
MMDPTERFSDRVENYVKYRPNYPPAVLETLQGACGLTTEAVIADIGSGTGILTEMFLRHGNPVYGVEPNQAMREAAERLLAGYPRFRSVAGRAEATTLPAHSVDFITAGQAFHWFEPTPTRAEFARILRPAGWVMLVWNERRNGATPFLRAYEQLLRRYAPEYPTVDHTRITPEDFAAFFGPRGYARHCFPNAQSLDWPGLRGRVLSSSYIPAAGHPQHAALLADLEDIFHAHQAGGTVAFEYDTMLYYGHL